MVLLSDAMKDVFIELNGGHPIANGNAYVLNLSIYVRKESWMKVSPAILRVKKLRFFGVCSVSLPSWPKANLEGYHEIFYKLFIKMQDSVINSL